MTVRRWATLAVLAAAACSTLEQPQQIPTAILHLYAQPGGAGRPEAMFLTAPPTTVPDNRVPPGAWQRADFIHLPACAVANLEGAGSGAFARHPVPPYVTPRGDVTV